MNVENNNGIEAWRQLVRREEPTEGAAQVSQLTRILGTTFLGGIDKWEEELRFPDLADWVLPTKDDEIPTLVSKCLDDLLISDWPV